MSAATPTRTQALRASALLTLTQSRARGALFYVVRVQRPHVRERIADGASLDITMSVEALAACERQDTSISIPELTAGALLIAADGSVCELRASCRRAAELLAGYIPLPKQPSFSTRVAGRALLLLRNGWRSNTDDYEQYAAEVNAQADTSEGTYKVFTQDPDDEQVEHARVNNAAWSEHS
jgi:hypothetical protein